HDGALIDQVSGQGGVIVEAKSADTCHNVIRAVGCRNVEATILEARDDGVPPLSIVTDELHIEGRGKLERGGDRDLKRVGRADGEEVVHVADARAQGWLRDQPTDPPPGDRERLAGAADGDRSLGNPGEGGDADVLAAIYEVLIDLVGDRNRVMLDAEIGDELELGSRVHPHVWIVRRADVYSQRLVYDGV